MKKQIWIMNHYAGNTHFDHSGRHYSFAKYLKRAGYEPVVFCCNAKHGKPELCAQSKEEIPAIRPTVLHIYGTEKQKLFIF